MITANELRIGNYLTDLSNAYLLVSGITNPDEDNNRKIVIDFGVEEKDIRFLCVPADELNPITLTPEMLESCGFTKYTHKNSWLNYRVEMSFQNEEYYCLFNTFKGQYVHQLQNLYFTLTGEELEIKL